MNSTSTTLRSALKKRKSFVEPVVVDNNFIDLVEYPNYYSLMVLNFVSSLTQNIEKIFYKFIMERKRRDIFVITMQEIEIYLQAMSEDPRYAVVLTEHESEENEEEQDGNVSENAVNHIIMAIRDKIDAAVLENDRILAQREALAKFRILDYWRTGVGVSEEKLSILEDTISNSMIRKEKGSNKAKKMQKPKSKKSRKSTTDVSIETDKHTVISSHSLGEFTYVIPEYDFINEIWSKLTQRGQERYDKLYIEDFPFMGPKIYVILLNFRDIDFIQRLVEEKLYLNTVIQVLPFDVPNDADAWNLIDIDRRRFDIFKTVTFFDHYIIPSDKPITCYKDQMAAYDLICNMFYDADDIRRQHQNFLTNCNLIVVEDEITVVVMPSEIEFLFSNVIEFYLINLYHQLGNDCEEEITEECDSSIIPTPPPITIQLFNDRIMVIENSYNFLKMNRTLKNFDLLNTIYYNYIMNMNKSYFARSTQSMVANYDYTKVKYVKNLTKYAFNEIIFQLNTICDNQVNHCESNYYKISSGPYRIVRYSYKKRKPCTDKVCYKKIVVPTALCHRDFNEFLVAEIQPWLNKQEFLYNDLLQGFLYEKYLDNLPKHIEFHIKFVKEQDFIYEPSIKKELHIKQQQQFQALKLKEYDKIFEYLDRKNTLIAEKSIIEHPHSLSIVAPDRPSLSGTKKDKKVRKGSIRTSSVVELDHSADSGKRSSTKTRISQIQPFQDLDDDDMIGIDLSFFQKHAAQVKEEKKTPIKEYNVYDLGDTRFQIEITDRKFHFKNGFVQSYLEDVLYKEKYQTVRLNFCLNQFLLNRIYLTDIHDEYLTKYVRVITENDTIINLDINEIYVEKHHTGWTPSYTTSTDTASSESSSSEEVERETENYIYTTSVVINSPNGLKLQIINQEELDDNIVEQEWGEGYECTNEFKRWYFSTGCCVVFSLNFVIIVYTPNGIIYEIGDVSEDEEETVDVAESPGQYEELERIYEFELNYLTFLVKFIIFDQFTMTLANGCKIFVQSGKIIKFLQQKPDKLLVKEHIDYVLGEIIIRREDGFKMLINSKEQIVIYPDGTIIKTEQVHQIENLDETSFSDVSVANNQTNLMMSHKKHIVSYLVNQVIKFSTSYHYQFVNRKSYHFFHENYFTIQWNLDTRQISFDNYDGSVHIDYNDGASITGILKNNITNNGCMSQSDKIEDLHFHINPDRMSIEHDNFTSSLHFRYINYHTNHKEHILVTVLEHEYLNRMNIMCNGTTDIIRNISEKCVYKREHPYKPFVDDFKSRDRTFLFNENNEDQCFELIMHDITCNRSKDQIFKDDDDDILMMNNLNAEVNSSFKATSNLFALIPERLATKPADLCKIDDDTLEIHEKQIKKNVFNKLSTLFGFEYYQKYSGKRPLKSYYCNNKRFEKLCENGINYFVDKQYQQLIDERDAKRGRLKPSAAFEKKMQEIETRLQLTNNYKYMLRYKIIPKYFDFHEAGDHIKNMDVSKYMKKLPRIRYSRDVPRCCCK